MAKEHNVELSSHGMQELHVSLVSSQAHGSWIEVHSFPIDTYTNRPLVLEDSMASNMPGTGVEFNWAKLNRHHDPD